MRMIAVACWVAILIAFCVLRRVALFAMAALVVLAAFVYISATASEPDSSATLAASLGLAAWSLGLSLVRAMLARSVSLKLLIASATGTAADFDESIASRLDDAVRYRLASSDGRRFELAPLGRLVSLAARAAYRATGTAR
jgi:hypothetical protein